MYGIQETDNPEKLDKQYQELTTQINKHQQEGSVILMGDINAKLEIQKEQCQQKESKNGQRLKNLMHNTKTSAINLLDTHRGVWTRENRNNQQEKPVIDYIITSDSITKQVIESQTDDQDIYQIKGRKRTDHNVLTATIRTNMTKTENKIKKWKKGELQQ